jgi:hypothetical protein
MAYRDKLSPWCVVCQLPNLQHSVVARCRRRSFAEEHLRVLQRINPAHLYEIMFDPAE